MKWLKTVALLFTFPLFSEPPCSIDSTIKKIISDSDLRAVDNWLTSVAPKTMTVIINKKPKIIHLNWAGLMYHLVLPEVACPPTAQTCAQCRLIGLHHDYMGALQSHGHIQIVPTEGNFKNSIYHADINYKGMLKESTFFPQAWNARTLAQQILHAFKNAIVNHASDRGVELQGKTTAGFDIIILTPVLGFKL